jgi:hypothetical protein
MHLVRIHALAGDRASIARSAAASPRRPSAVAAGRALRSGCVASRASVATTV